MDEVHRPVTTRLVSPPTLLATTLGTARSGREAGQSSSLSPNENRQLGTHDRSPETPGEVLVASRLQKEEEKDEEDEEDEEEDEEDSGQGQNQSPDPLPLPREEPEPDWEPSVKDLLPDHRGNRKSFLLLPDPYSD